ncbi:MAG: hypothetical protein ACREFY_21580 [Acetobacteraceae bacterium]
MQTPVHALFRLAPGGFAEPSGFPLPETPLAQVLGLTAGLLDTLGVARALAETGRRLDLAGLDSQIGLLCARMLDLEPDEGRVARVELIRLRADLDALAAVLARPPPSAA